MSEKRFVFEKVKVLKPNESELIQDKEVITDMEEMISYDFKDCEDVLNSLSVENERLRQQVEEWKTIAVLGKEKGFR